MLAGLGGCGPGDAEMPAGEPGITREARQGPVQLVMTATPAEFELSQHVQLELEVLAEKDVTVLESGYEHTLSEGDRAFQFRVVRSQEEPAMLTDDGRLRWVYRYELEFFLPGDHDLPPATVSFIDRRLESAQPRDPSQGTGAAEVQSVSTEALTVSVGPPGGAALSEQALRDIIALDPIELPRGWARWWWFAALLMAILVVGAVLLLRRSRRRRATEVVQIPAHEWARQQLAALIAEEWLAKGRVQEFYYRISAIVRGYIERRFGVSAPEMTTQEFLAAASRDGRFGRDTTTDLNRFLSACDLVKYARHEPRSEESDAVLRTAGDFVERTRERDTTADAGGTPPSPIEERAA